MIKRTICFGTLGPALDLRGDGFHCHSRVHPEPEFALLRDLTVATGVRNGLIYVKAIAEPVCYTSTIRLPALAASEWTLFARAIGGANLHV